MMRLSRVSLVAMCVLLPGIIFWAAKMQFGISAVEAWLPQNNPELRIYRQFRAQFGSDQFLIVSWPGCFLHDPRLPQMVERLNELATQQPELRITEIQDSASLIELLSGQNEQAKPRTGGNRAASVRATSEQAGVSTREEEAIRKLKGFAIGRDGSCFITLELAGEPTESNSRLIEQIQGIAREVLGSAADQLILAGEPYQVHMIDQSSRSAMQRLVAPSTILALIIAWLCLRSWRLTLLVFAFAGTGQLLGMAVISLFLGEMAAVMVVLPTLVFMLTLSAAVHLTNYFVDAGGFQGRSAGLRATKLGAMPCALATITTVFGFASLSVSQLAPVWQFGTLSAISLVTTSAITLLTFPAVCELACNLFSWAEKNGYRANHFGGWRKSGRGQYHGVSYRRFPNLMEILSSRAIGERVIWALGRWTRQQASLLTLLGCGLLVLSFVGLGRLDTSTEFEDMFSARSDAVRSLNWVREHIGPINSLEYLVSFPHPEDGRNGQDLLAELGLVDSLHRQFGQQERVEAVLSAGSFLPALPTGKGTRGTIRRAVFRRSLEARLDDLQRQGILFQASDANIWRISLRIRGLRGDNYADISRQLGNTGANVIAEAQSQGNELRVSGQLSGLRTVVETAHRALITDLATSFAAAFLLITPVMMLIVRGFLSGLILMIPNILPVAFVFGCMGWLGTPLDVASILTASVALGIAVDDTLHFLTWYFRSRRAGEDAEVAVQRAIAACARPMAHTTFICSAAMLPFFFSQFLPTSKFALLMILILAGAIIGDLILLPALLQSPLGRWIGSQKSNSQDPSVTENAG